MPDFSPPRPIAGHHHFASRLIDVDDQRNGTQSKFWLYCIAYLPTGRSLCSCEPEFKDLAAEVIRRCPLPVFGGAS